MLRSDGWKKAGTKHLEYIQPVCGGTCLVPRPVVHLEQESGQLRRPEVFREVIAASRITG